MKANELRIGNWVNTIRGIKQVASLKVQKVKDGEYISIGYQDADYSISTLLEDHCSGILLTPEVLEKCGYKIYEGTSDEIRAGRLVMQFALYKQGYKVNVFIGGEYLGFREYLHQLQNLFYSLWETELIYTP